MKRTLILLEIVILIFFLYWHLRLGLVRYFDADEFAHLHWGYSLLSGEKPYTDFFYLFPPFFLYPIAFLIKIFGRSISAIIAARVFVYIIFLVTCGVLFLIAKKMRGIYFALLTTVIFAFLPLPFDKMIEIRPDLAATMFSLLGMLLLIEGYEESGGYEGGGDGGGRRKKYFFAAGLSYAVSLGFVPKTVFFLVPVGVVMAVGYLSNLSDLSRRKEEMERGLYFGMGFLAVAAVLFLLIFSYGNLPLGIYSMTRMASEVTKTLGAKFFMLPNIFFYPNNTYYGFPGWSMPLVLNLLIYLSASIWGIHRLISGGFGGYEGGGKNKNWGEFLIAGSFWANLFAFVYFYPLKHAQYLIPVTPFIAYYFADLWEMATDRLPKELKSLKSLKAGVILILVFPLLFVGFSMNKKKEQWVNKPTFEKVNYLLSTVPKGERIFDLTGESIFFPNGYYFCCLPYGQYEEAIHIKLPDIGKDMEKRRTNYVYLGDTQRLKAIPIPHARYIVKNFEGVNEEGTLLKRKRAE